MTSILALLTGAAGKYIGYAALAGSIVAGGAWLLHEHDVGIQAQQQIAIDKADADALAQDHARQVAALEATAAEAQQRATYLEQLKVQIHAQPASTACASSPAIRVMLDGLRHAAGGPGATSAGSGKPAKLP